MKLKKDKYEKKIRDEIRNWLIGLNKYETISLNIKALNFGFQKVFEGYELYLSGHDEYSENHDTWLLDEVYSPQNDFVGLGVESLAFSIDEFKVLYKEELLFFLNSRKLNFVIKVEFICVSYVLGSIEKIYSY